MVELYLHSPIYLNGVDLFFTITFNSSLIWGSRDSAVGIATGYGLGGQGLRLRVLLRERFPHLHVIRTSSGAHPALYPACTGSFFRRGKAAGT
jgi:hypothetical protein